MRRFESDLYKYWILARENDALLIMIALIIICILLVFGRALIAR